MMGVGVKKSNRGRGGLVCTRDEVGSRPALTGRCYRGRDVTGKAKVSQTNRACKMRPSLSTHGRKVTLIHVSVTHAHRLLTFDTCPRRMRNAARIRLATHTVATHGVRLPGSSLR